MTSVSRLSIESISRSGSSGSPSPMSRSHNAGCSPPRSCPVAVVVTVDVSCPCPDVVAVVTVDVIAVVTVDVSCPCPDVVAAVTADVIAVVTVDVSCPDVVAAVTADVIAVVTVDVSCPDAVVSRSVFHAIKSGVFVKLFFPGYLLFILLKNTPISAYIVGCFSSKYSRANISNRRFCLRCVLQLLAYAALFLVVIFKHLTTNSKQPLVLLDKVNQ